MNKTQLAYQQTGYFSQLMGDYLDGKEALKPFYNNGCAIDSFKSVLTERKEKPIDRTTLVNALQEQYVGFEIAEPTKMNIENLKKDNCFTVTTGHQLNLLTGPLYFFYKIVSAINLAKDLKAAYPENEFVPVYWMATEDHDFEEVNHFNLFKKRYELSKTQNGAVGSMKLTGIEEVLEELKTDLGDRGNASAIIALFSKYYQASNTFTEAIKGMVNHFFSKHGLVIVDGDDAMLKQLMTSEFENEILNQTNHHLINTSSEKLISLGYKAQVTPREINLFYLQDNLRERIVWEQDQYRVLNTTIQFSETDIIQELKDHPERFSPNAPMRCMYQEKILPNLAYIGGGGELAYWFQLKEMFDANHISFPTLVLRNSVLFVDKGSSKKLTKLKMEIADLFTETEALIKNYLKNASTVELNLKEEEGHVNKAFETIIEKAGAIDQSLQPFVKAELQKTMKSLKNIEGRLIKGVKQKKEVTVNQIRNLKEKLFPNNSLQERKDNIISLLLFNDESIIDELVQNLNPLDQQFTILSE